MGAFKNGGAAEEIALKYPALQLEDIYATIAFYLTHRAEVDRFLDKQEELADEAERANRADPAVSDLRKRILARKSGT